VLALKFNERSLLIYLHVHRTQTTTQQTHIFTLCKHTHSHTHTQIHTHMQRGKQNGGQMTEASGGIRFEVPLHLLINLNFICDDLMKCEYFVQCFR